jgi:hypothetical protein
MDPIRSFFNDQFKPRLEEKILEIQDPLDDGKDAQAKTWVTLYTETDESLRKRSRTRRSVRRKARYFARRVYVIDARLFVLCSLSYTISGLPVIPRGTFYDEIGEWWKLKAVPKPLSDITIVLCRNLPSSEEERVAIHHSLPGQATLLEARNVFRNIPAEGEGNNSNLHSFLKPDAHDISM